MGGGEKHYQTARRIAFPKTARELAGAQRPACTSVIEDRAAIRLAQKPGHLSPEHSEAYMVGGPLPGSPRPSRHVVIDRQRARPYDGHGRHRL